MTYRLMLSIASAAVLVFGIALMPARSAVAQTVPSYVVGVGVGPLRFTEQDDVRAISFLDLDVGVQFQLYGEWNMTPRLGFGARFLSVGVSETAVAFNNEVTTTAGARGFLGTVHYAPVVADDGGWRILLLAGLGPARYDATRTFNGQRSEGDAGGRIVLLGTAFDWGGEGFGVRVGLNVVRSRFASLTLDPASAPLNVDVSGSGVVVDLRWGFQ